MFVSWPPVLFGRVFEEMIFRVDVTCDEKLASVELPQTNLEMKPNRFDAREKPSKTFLPSSEEREERNFPTFELECRSLGKKFFEV